MVMRLVRRLSVALTALAVALGAAGIAAPSAQASTASTFDSLINSARASAGLGAYAVRSDLAAVAQGQAQRMAASQKLYHNPSLASQVKGWQYVGENVGYGPDVNTLMSAFMHSPSHKANILDHQFTQVGVGAVTVGSTIWVSMVFRQPMGGSSSTTTTHHSTSSTKHTTTGGSTSRPGTRAAGKVVVAARTAPPAAAAPDLPDGIRCLGGPAVARRLRNVADLDHTVRLVEVSQHLVLGFQCGSHLPLTGVLDTATLRALAA